LRQRKPRRADKIETTQRPFSGRGSKGGVILNGIIRIACCAFCAIFFSQALCAASEDTLPDISTMSFTVEKYKADSKIAIENMLFNVHKTIDAPEGSKFVVVTLKGRLDGLRNKYKFVPKFREQFVAIVDEGDKKTAYKADMIQTIVGWEIEDRTWALGTPTDHANDDGEYFSVAFGLPVKITNFELGVIKNDGSGSFVSVGKIDLTRDATKAKDVSGAKHGPKAVLAPAKPAVSPSTAKHKTRRNVSGGK
jgi:hypothetical protein